MKRPGINPEQCLRISRESAGIIEQVIETSNDAMTQLATDFGNLANQVRAARSQQLEATRLLPRLCASLLGEFNALTENVYALAHQSGIASSRVNDRLAGHREQLAALVAQIGQLAQVPPDTTGFDATLNRLITSMQFHDLCTQWLSDVARERLPELNRLLDEPAGQPGRPARTKAVQHD